MLMFLSEITDKRPICYVKHIIELRWVIIGVMGHNRVEWGKVDILQTKWVIKGETLFHWV